MQQNYRHLIFLFGVSLLALSVPTSKFGMSLAQMILAANWLLDKTVIKKFSDFFHNKVALVFSMLFFLHVLWLFNTSDFQYALDDLRTKAPILILVIIFSTTPRLTAKEFHGIMLLHAAAVLAMSFVAAKIYVVEQPADFRLISPYVSHIRLALNVCIAIFTLAYFTRTSNLQSVFLKGVYLLLIGWLLYFLTLLQSATGLIIVLVCSIILIVRSVVRSNQRKWLKISILLGCVIIPLALVFSIVTAFKRYDAHPYVDFSKLETRTSRGGLYFHDTITWPTENGKWIGLYMCPYEVQEAWNERSKIKYNTPDSNGEIINYYVMRYLNSKNLRKDYDGVYQLTEADIQNIEKKIASVDYVSGQGVTARLHKLFWEYQAFRQNGDIKGHSLFQRFELWKISIHLIQAHWGLGVGTGDVPDAFKKQLELEDSPLKGSRMRSHNQFLSLFVAFGVVGFLLSVFAMLYPFLRTKLLYDYFCGIFLMVFLLSLLTEDTIESQDGLTFFAFFAALYLFQKPISVLFDKTKTITND